MLEYTQQTKQNVLYFQTLITTLTLFPENWYNWMKFADILIDFYSIPNSNEQINEWKEAIQSVVIEENMEELLSLGLFVYPRYPHLLLAHALFDHHNNNTYTY